VCVVALLAADRAREAVIIANRALASTPKPALLDLKTSKKLTATDQKVLGAVSAVPRCVC
jgi:hypothetical protein